MPSTNSIIQSLIEALPDDGDARSELVALGSVASAIINSSDPAGRADLVECFCRTLRRSVATELN